MNDIELINVSKSYGDVSVIDNLNLKICGGKRTVILGPSGCGKSTLLRMIAGLETITSGDLIMNDKKSQDIDSGLRDVAMVFQNYALYPNMTVSENITFALKANKLAKEEIDRRLDKVLEMLRLEKYSKRLPRDLSGGQRQRVALARAVVKRSKYFLLDEPLSNLDVTLRHEARKQLVDIYDTYQQTMVYVTHDQVEAMTLGHKIVLMNAGRVMMNDTPYEVYNYPKNLFTATFIGSPKMNILKVRRYNDRVKIDKKTLHLSESWREFIKDIKEEELLLGVRPEHLEIIEKESETSFLGTITFIENLGPHNAITINHNDYELIVLDEKKGRKIGDIVNFKIDEEKIHLFNIDTEESIGYPKEIK